MQTISPTLKMTVQALREWRSMALKIKLTMNIQNSTDEFDVSLVDDTGNENERAGKISDLCDADDDETGWLQMTKMAQYCDRNQWTPNH
ncbi:hypothetical protein ACOSQ2_000182 [Xanthoceras sorbifolium]